MSKYVDADEVIKVLTNNQTYSATVLQAIIDRIPKADVEPVQHGRWIEHTDQSMYINGEKQIVKYCSVCGEAAPYNAIGRQFYPARCYCGAKMDKKEIENEK